MEPVPEFLEEAVPVWKYFNDIRQLPRPSKHEQHVQKYLIEYANTHGYDYYQDKTGNIIIYVPGTIEGPTVCIQAHMDMVCQKTTDKQIDFLKDPIQLVRKGDYLHADGTTLGADNGIGLSIALALAADKSIERPPLELLFTVDEESGMTGVLGLEPGKLKAKYLLNLDTEEENSIYIGCAGGIDVEGRKQFTRLEAPALNAFSVTISGLKGGHSGADIHLHHLGNAIKALASVLAAIDADSEMFHIERINGGSARNALPRDARATFMTNLTEDQVSLIVSKEQETIGKVMQGLQITAEPAEVGDVIPMQDSQDILTVLNSMHSGVYAMSETVPGLVETSNNLGVVQTDENTCTIIALPRSSNDPALHELVNQFKSLFAHSHMSFVAENGYPGWQPDPDSALLHVAKQVHKETLGIEPEVMAIHAGLECGLIKKIYPDLDMISFGPTIKGAHSPDERVHIPSVERTWKFLLELIKKVK